MTDGELELRGPANQKEWLEFHNIRRRVLFENRGKRESYIENHPDDFKRGNHPLVLVDRGVVIGVCRLDVLKSAAWLRRVAIRQDLQRKGRGRVLLRLAESFAVKLDCKEVRTNAAVEAVGFYERCGYSRDCSTGSPPNSVSMVKLLS